MVLTPVRILRPEFYKDGCVLYLKFDEGSGSIATDSSPFKNNGTIYGAIWADGKFGKALSFDGVDDYVEVVGASVLDTIKTRNAVYTFSAWINPLAIRTMQIFQRASSSSDRHGFALASDGSIRLSHYDGSAWKAVGSAPISPGWHHVAAVFNTRDDMRVYVDGVEFTTSSPHVYAYTWSYLEIGRHSNYYNDWFYGVIDEVLIFNRVLSEEEIKALYRGGRFPPFK